MEIYKNKASGKFSIFIHDSGQNKALFVTPNCEIRSVKKYLFHKPKEGDESYFISQNLISKEQVERYAQYETDRSEKIVDDRRPLLEQQRSLMRQKIIKEFDEKYQRSD